MKYAPKGRVIYLADEVNKQNDKIFLPIYLVQNNTPFVMSLSLGVVVCVKVIMLRWICIQSFIALLKTLQSTLSQRED